MTVLARHCDTCGACCKIYDIAEPALAKPAGSWCPNWQRDKGCGIYDARPGICRSFQCAWILGHGAEQDRPDRTKIVIDITSPLSAEIARGVIRMSEFSVDALGGAYARRMTASFLAQHSFVSHAHLSGKRRLFVPKARFLNPETRAQLTAIGIEIIL